MPASCAPPPTVSVLFFKDYEVMIQASDGRGGLNTQDAGCQLRLAAKGFAMPIDAEVEAAVGAMRSVGPRGPRSMRKSCAPTPSQRYRPLRKLGAKISCGELSSTTSQMQQQMVD